MATMARSQPQIGTPDFGRIGRRQLYTLPIEQLHPSIRIAHRQGAIDINRRIIFDHELILILAGRGSITIAGSKYPIKPHRLFLLEPYTPHRITMEADDDAAHAAVHFDLAPSFPPFAEALQHRPAYRVALSHGMRLPVSTVLPANHPIESQLLELIDVRQQGGPLAELQAASILLRILIALLRSPRPAEHEDETSARNQARIERALQFIVENLQHDISVQDMADAAGLSESHFNRLFREWTGKSPSQHLRQVRIEKARRLLANIDLSIKEIASQTGFSDQYHFSKVFRQVDGLTPTLYREAAIASRNDASR